MNVKHAKIGNASGCSLTAYSMILRQSDGWYLYGISGAFEITGDTWHPSIDEAMEQAAYSYGILEGDWKNFDLSDGEDVLNTIRKIYSQ